VGRPKACSHFDRVVVEPISDVRPETDRWIVQYIRLYDYVSSRKVQKAVPSFSISVPLIECVYATSLKRNSLNIFLVHFFVQ
jgi:hypothetical protein